MKIKKQIKLLRSSLSKKAYTFHARAQAYASARPHKTLRATIAADRKKIGGHPLPKLRVLIRDSLRMLWADRWLFAKLGLLYAAVSYIVVGGLSQVDFVTLKQASQEIFTGGWSALANAGTLFVSAASGTLNSSATELQQFLGGALAFVFWLLLVWTVRMRLAGTQIKVRDALYNAGAPLISSLIVMVVIVAQLIPAAVGLFIYSVAQTGGVLKGGVEVMMFVFAAVLLSLLSLYWVSGSAVAMITVTLPGTYPWKALSASSRLVIGQRRKLFVRMIALCLVVVVLWALLLIPVLYLDAWLNFEWLPLVPIMVQVLATCSLLFASVYIYKLYRSLLGE